MRYLITVLVMLAVVPFATVQADIIVIVNADSSITQLTQRQITDIYMGRQPDLQNGQELKPLDQPLNSVVREAFYFKMTGKPISMINAYWARLLFTGRASPPTLIEDNQAMLAEIVKNPNAIGYLESENLSEDVKVIYRLKDNE